LSNRNEQTTIVSDDRLDKTEAELETKDYNVCEEKTLPVSAQRLPIVPTWISRK